MSLRNGKTLSRETSDLDSMTSTTSPRTSRRPRLSPYLLLIYPVIIALGSAFYHISPVTRSPAAPGYAAPLSPGMVSDQHATSIPHTLNYFADKRNIVNRYFVKIGWFWTTLAFVLLPLTIYQSSAQASRNSNGGGSGGGSGNTQKQSSSGRMLRSYLRYTLVTLMWIVSTQWFFGPALIDRSFVLTGGHCEALPTQEPMSTETTAKINALPTLLSAVTCKAAGGSWRGGHDISGHVFMLVLSSAFLLYELQVADSRSSHPSISPQAAANLSKQLSEEEKKAVGGWESEGAATLRIWVRRFVYAVIALDLWMLMMTAVFFHTWLEKTSGLVLAGASLWGVYFLGDIVPAWNAIVGL